MSAGVFSRSASRRRRSRGAGALRDETRRAGATSRHERPQIDDADGHRRVDRDRPALQQDLLRAPVVDLGGVDHVRIAAVHLVDRRELARRLAGAAELADDRAVELHLVDLAGELGGGRPARCPARSSTRRDTACPGFFGPGPPDTHTAHGLPTFV